MAKRTAAEKITWRKVKSKNVAQVGWGRARRLYVIFISGGAYFYEGVSRQRAVACARAKSVGSYLAREIYPNHHAVRGPFIPFAKTSIVINSDPSFTTTEVHIKSR
jgi:hypothetical protein